MSSTSRRAFLRQAAAFSSLGAAAPLGINLAALGNASAQSASTDYQALVCIFMYGGNDAYNMVLATDGTSWTHYNNHRDPASRNSSDTSTSLALLAAGTPADTTAEAGSPARLGGVLPIGHGNRPVHSSRSFALNPCLTAVKQMYDAGRVAVLANVGPLIRPTSKANYALDGFAKPAKLFSHNDQQSTWQSFSPEGSSEGWGGRFGDLLMANNGTGSNASLIQHSFTCITPSSQQIWLAGRNVRQYQVGTFQIAGLGQYGRIYGDANLFAGVKAVMNATDDANLFVQDHQAVVDRGIQAYDVMNAALPPYSQGPWGTPGQYPWSDPMLAYVGSNGQSKVNMLAVQLQMVARLIDANRRGGMGIRKQVFMVSAGAYDTHANQNPIHADCMLQLNHAMAYFDAVLANMPGGDMRPQVTTFTASEFGRSFTNNGDGTDHGWGAHHFIMGGAVRGGEVYGSFPQYSTADSSGYFSSFDQINNGIMLPSTSVDQYAYTLGKWMGVSTSDLATILPNIGNFNSSVHDLGFMG